MSTNKKWDDASQKDLIFAILMSTGDGSGNIKANWPEVERIMTSWGYGFTAGAMCKFWHLHMPTGAFIFQSSVAYASIEAFHVSPLPPSAQQWSKKIQKEFKARHPDTANGGGGSNSNSNPATPSKATGSSRPPKTPASTKGKIKGRKRLAADDDEDTSPEGGAFNPTPIAKEKTPRAGVKKMKYSEPEEGEDDEEEDVVVKGETKDDEDYSHAV